jgi:hypothetical protein
MQPTLNEVYSSLTMKRRYEVWFLRLGLADGGGAWWFRYLLMNPGRNGCSAQPAGMPVQVWATWFPRGRDAQHWIQGFALNDLALSHRHRSSFSFSVPGNFIDDQSCHGEMRVDGHEIRWNLRYHSHFRATLRNKGWIGFSRTPHSDAKFSGEIQLDGRTFRGDPLGSGVQGHNCGFRHRNFWTWTHAAFTNSDGSISTLEALIYEMPFGLVFRKALLWHAGKAVEFRKFEKELRDRDSLKWYFSAERKDGVTIDVAIDGSGPSAHRLPYLKTDCSGTFEVANNSLTNARIVLNRPGQPPAQLETEGGAALEMAGGS